MLKRYLMVVVFSMVLVASTAIGEYKGDVNAAPRATTMALQQTCSCGMDCPGAGGCTFDCSGSISACVRCIADCCRREEKRVCK